MKLLAAVLANIIWLLMPIEALAGVLGETTVFNFPSTALTKSGEATYGHHEYTQFSQDILMNSIDISLRGMTLGSSFDVCLYLVNLSSPLYGHFTGAGSEIWCSYFSRGTSAQDWEAHVNLTNTPLYVPAGTRVYCSTGGAAPNAAGQPTFDCGFNYSNYIQGNKRYRSLRFPYIDQAALPDGTIPNSYYLSNPIFPLKVRGFSFFQSYGGATRGGSTHDICLIRFKQGGTLVTRTCAPDQAIVRQNYDNPLTVFPVSWDIPEGEILAASCTNTSEISDCGIWAFVEIPPDIPNTIESIYADYGMVDGYLATYCNNYAPYFSHPIFCNGQDPCTTEAKKAGCQKVLFPKASATTPTPVLRPTGVPGDFNNDRRTDLADFAVWKKEYLGQTSTKTADFNQDGRVDLVDFSMWKSEYLRQ